MIWINNRQVEVDRFPNGEVGVRSNLLGFLNSKCNKISMRYESPEDLLVLEFVKLAIDEKLPKVRAILHCPYLPYSRMDRRNDSFLVSLKYVIAKINSMDFHRVFVDDLHSDVSATMLDRVVHKSNVDFLFQRLMKHTGDSGMKVIVFPDASAYKRYGSTFPGYPHLIGEKRRNFSDGKIVDLQLRGETSMSEKHVVIVDDLCSRGGTFLPIVKMAREADANRVDLVVGHCENTIFDGDLLKTAGVDQVFTTNSILTRSHKLINVVGVFNEGYDK